MANFDVNNFAIDRVLRGIMTSPKDGSVQWSINQITEPSLNITAESAEVVDAIGSPIASFNRGKKAEFSATNSLFDLSLLAAQNGNEKKVATNEEKIIAPAFETIVVPTPATTAVKLKHKPIMTPTAIYALNGDGTLGEKLVYNASKEEGKFTYDEESYSITFPDGAVANTEYFVNYEYEATKAVSVEGDAINFPKAGKFVMEVLGSDVCDPSTLVHAYVIYPNAKLDANVNLSLATDGKHPFKLIAQQAYCDKKKLLFQIVIPDEE